MKLLEIVSNNGFLLDVFGVIGLGLLGLAAARLAQRHGSRSARVMTLGALALIIGRLGMVIVGHFITPLTYFSYSEGFIRAVNTVPMLLLTVGLGAVVWGFWSHERELAGADTD